MAAALLRVREEILPALALIAYGCHGCHFAPLRAANVLLRAANDQAAHPLKNNGISKQ